MNAVTQKLWRFEPLDTVFFRDGRPFNAGDSVWLDSIFPPTGRTLQGCIRTAMGDYLGIDWHKYREACKEETSKKEYLVNGINLIAELGDANCLGNLRLRGPFITLQDELIFPAPLDLYHSTEGFGLLTPSDPVTCDLGNNQRLPAGKGREIRTLAGKYLSAMCMGDLLAGSINRWKIDPPTAISCDKIWSVFADEDDSPALADLEPKVGLARDNQTRKHKNSMLYSIASVRLRPGVGFAMLVSTRESGLHPIGPVIQRLGGEGKLVRIIASNPPALPIIPDLLPRLGRVCFKLVIITPTRLTNMGWLPKGFEKRPGPDNSGWTGMLQGWAATGDAVTLTDVTIVSACVGKAIKIGGWDLTINEPRPLEAFVPAGSIYFCEMDASQTSQLQLLHGGSLGDYCEYGFGQLLIGTW